jgi:TRAP transporter 4TM/12TM fusion protein
MEHRNYYLFFSLLLVFLTTLKSKKNRWPLILPLIAMALLTTGYIWYYYWPLTIIHALPSLTDTVISFILIFVVWEAARQSFGIIVPLIGLTFILYIFFGQYLPFPLWHFPVTLKGAASVWVVGLDGRGMYGIALGMMADYVFLFIIFGVLFEVTGASRFFTEVGKLASRRLVSGAGMTAVISSALVGTSSGSGSANVAITAPFTVPLMKRAGYKPEQAGAIEAVASTGGQLMPPIMGISAFVMAEMTGTPYLTIITMAIIPAILYYLCLGLYTHLQARRLKLRPIEEPVDRKQIELGAPIFIVPLITLVVLLIMGHSLQYCVFWALVLVVVISLFRKETRGTPKLWIELLTRGAVLGAKIGVITGILGIIISSFGLAGIGLKFTSIIMGVSGGNMWIALTLAALVMLILGCGIPGFAAYIMVSLMVVPGLLKMGIAFMSAHFFVYLFAISALVTPPIGMSVIVVAPIAGAEFWKTAREAVKAAVVVWLLPFLVIIAPMVILQPVEPLLEGGKLVIAFVTVLFLQVLVVGYYLTEVSRKEMAVVAIVVASLITFITIGNLVALLVGVGLGILLTLEQWRKKGQLEVSSTS